MRMEKTKVGRKHRKYDQGFKEEALRMVRHGQSVATVAKALGISENLLYNWRSSHQSGLSASDATSQSELEQLRKQLRVAETERDILKKALFIFGRST